MSENGSLRVLIVDDEPLARQRLEDLLATQQGVEVAGTADSGPAAVEAIRTLAPDLVFLDVQMPGFSGVEVVRAVGAERMPVTVFVTAYDQYALQAFELAALDYLIKPFDDERFAQAFARARRMVAFREMDAMRGHLLALLQRSGDAPTGEAPPPPPRYLERIAVDMRGKIHVVPVERIDFITSDGPYAELHAGDERYVIREQMQTLEERLDPDRFFRIHRSTIVRLDRIETLLLSPGGDYAVQLTGGKRLKVSRNRREALEQRLGLHGLG